jgi:hypothetical protein
LNPRQRINPAPPFQGGSFGRSVTSPKLSCTFKDRYIVAEKPTGSHIGPENQAPLLRHQLIVEVLRQPIRVCLLLQQVDQAGGSAELGEHGIHGIGGG